MQIHQELISLSLEAVWFASICASFRERLIVVQRDMVWKRRNIIECILPICGKFDGVMPEQESEVFNRFTGIVVLWFWSLSPRLPLL